MSRLLILDPMPVSAIGGTLPGAARLLTPDPREACGRFVSQDARTIEVDLGSVRQVDTVFLGHVLAPQMPAIAIATGITAQGETPLAQPLVEASNAGGPYRHYFVALAAPVAVRYLRLTLALGVGGTAGVLAIGQALVPQWGDEWGGGRTLGDSSAVTRLPGGGLAVDQGATWGGYQWTFADLGDDELAALYGIARRRGVGRPLLVVEDPVPTAGLAERIHWGVFLKFEAYERKAPGLTSWALKLDDWL